MSTKWADLGLTPAAMKKARSEAAIVLGDNPPTWDSLAFDDQNSMIDKYLAHLRESRNTSIAEKLELDRDGVRELLRNKVKQLRKKGMITRFMISIAKHIT